MSAEHRFSLCIHTRTHTANRAPNPKQPSSKRVRLAARASARASSRSSRRYARSDAAHAVALDGATHALAEGDGAAHGRGGGCCCASRRSSPTRRCRWCSLTTRTTRMWARGGACWGSLGAQDVEQTAVLVRCRAASNGGRCAAQCAVRGGRQRRRRCCRAARGVVKLTQGGAGGGMPGQPVGARGALRPPPHSNHGGRGRVGAPRARRPMGQVARGAVAALQYGASRIPAGTAGGRGQPQQEEAGWGWGSSMCVAVALGRGLWVERGPARVEWVCPCVCHAVSRALCNQVVRWVAAGLGVLWCCVARVRVLVGVQQLGAGALAWRGSPYWAGAPAADVLLHPRVGVVSAVGHASVSEA